MGIVNVTPDSFSDGGRLASANDAVAYALRLVDEGADVVDVGGESTRPGSDAVDAEIEASRVLPVIEELAKLGVRISIDTSKHSVARRALERGAEIVNDVSGLRDPAMIDVCAEFGCGVCIMHMQGVPKSMQTHPVYGDVVRDVREYLQHSASVAESNGVSRSKIWIDPGLGFGKSYEHNLELLKRLDELAALGYPIVVGLSRKSFLGRMASASPTATLPIEERDEAMHVAHVQAIRSGAKILRVHDVARVSRAINAQMALEG